MSASSNKTFGGYPPFATFVNVKDLFGERTKDIHRAVLAGLPTYADVIAKASGNALHAATQEKLLRTQINLIFEKSVPVAEFLTVPSGNIVGSAFWGLLPFARGSVHMSSNNISSPPAINPNFFMLDWDQELQVAAARLARKSLSLAPLNSVINAEITPGAAVPVNASNEVWMRWLKDNCTLVHLYLVESTLTRAD